MATTSGPTPHDVRGVLAGVVDPELHVGIVDLGMVRDIDVSDEGVVTVQVALTTAACPLRGQIKKDVASKVRGLPGVTDVKVDYTEMTQEQRSDVMQRARLEAANRSPETEVPPNARVLAVASGKGGVGKSSVTVNLAVALASHGYTVGVLDADIWGFSVPRMLGLEERLAGEAGDDGRGLINPSEREIAGVTPLVKPGHVKVVSMGLLVDDEDTALMWRGLILSKALEQFLTDVRWGELDYLLLDMPPGTGDIQMALGRLLPAAELLVVTTPALAAQKVASRIADMAHRSYLKVAGVVENMSEFVAPDGSRHEIFGSGGGAALAEEIGAPLVAQIPVEAAVAAGGDSGTPIVLADPTSPAAREFGRLASRITDDLLPPVEMAGCTARILDIANENLAAVDAAK